MKEFTEKFKALTDETRLRILYLLTNSNSELCVCELTDALEIPQYNISRHLRILKSAGLIEERKEGRWVNISLIKNNNTFTETILNAISQIPEALLAKDLAELEKRFAIRKGGICLVGVQKKTFAEQWSD
jgi:ArsR family transcriptional regulator